MAKPTVRNFKAQWPFKNPYHIASFGRDGLMVNTRWEDTPEGPGKVSFWVTYKGTLTSAELSELQGFMVAAQGYICELGCPNA